MPRLRRGSRLAPAQYGVPSLCVTTALPSVPWDWHHTGAGSILMAMGGNLATRYETELGRIVARLRERYRPERILVFGSVARGDLCEDSDIDLLVIKRTSKRWLDRAAEARLLLDTDLAVDVVVYTPEEFDEKSGSGDPVFRDILTEARTLYDVRTA